MKLVFTIDVEEEGLFRGRHPRQPAGVANVAELRRLEPLIGELKLVPTLLVAHAAARDPESRALLGPWRARHGAELGAHLHPWSTPPFAKGNETGSVNPDLLPDALLEAKIHTLIEAVGAIAGRAPRSFRMGRYHLTPTGARLLAAAGIRVDGSAVPLRTEVGGPDWFGSPADPYRMETAAGPLLEAPLTIVPIWPATARLWHRAAGRLPPGLRPRVLSAFRRLGAAGIQPAWFSLPVMKLAARLHVRRGGRVLHMHLHSSELMPGATPAFRTAADVDRLVARIHAFVTWVRREMRVESVPLSGLCGDAAGTGALSLVSTPRADHSGPAVRPMQNENQFRDPTT